MYCANAKAIGKHTFIKFTLSSVESKFALSVYFNISLKNHMFQEIILTQKQN